MAKNALDQKNIWHSEKRFRRKKIYDIVKNTFDEKRYMTWWETLSTKKDIWQAQKGLCWLSLDLPSYEKKHMQVIVDFKQVAFCFCCSCCGYFYFSEWWCLFHCFLLRWLRGKVITDGRSPMHSELPMLDGRCTMHVSLRVDRRCPMHAKVPTAVVRTAMHSEVPNHVRHSGPLIGYDYQNIFLECDIYFTSARFRSSTLFSPSSP